MNEAPLSIELKTSEIKTAVPLIADGTWARYQLDRINQSEVEVDHDVIDPNGNRTTQGIVLTWEYSLVDPVPTTEGSTLKPGDFGSKFFDRIQLYAKPEAKDPKWYWKRISSRIDALLGTADPGNSEGKPERPDFGPALVPMLIGRNLYAKMKVRTGDYKGNEFSECRFPGDMAV